MDFWRAGDSLVLQIAGHFAQQLDWFQQGSQTGLALHSKFRKVDLPDEQIVGNMESLLRAQITRLLASVLSSTGPLEAMAILCVAAHWIYRRCFLTRRRRGSNNSGILVLQITGCVWAYLWS